MSVKINPIEDRLFRNPDKPEDLVFEKVYQSKDLLNENAFVIVKGYPYQFIPHDKIEKMYGCKLNNTDEGIFLSFGHDGMEHKGYLRVGAYTNNLMCSKFLQYSVFTMFHVFNFYLDAFNGCKELNDYWRKMDWFKILNK